MAETGDPDGPPQEPVEAAAVVEVSEQLQVH